MANEMVRGVRRGAMARDTKASGSRVVLAVKVNCTMLTATSMMETGSMIRQMGTEPTHMQTVQNTRASGWTTSSTARAMRLGLMAPSTTASTPRARRMGRANSHSLTSQSTRVNS
jgi:hypothetical protein